MKVSPEEIAAQARAEAQTMSDEALEQAKTEAYQRFQMVVGGNSSRAIDNNWARYEAFRSVQQQREQEPR